MLEGYLPSKETAPVACGDCRLCCKKSLILLMPDQGDDVESYETIDVGGGRKALAHKRDGSCIYLGDQGCTIHGRHPIICRVYDCAAQYRSMSRAERKQAIAEGLTSKEIVAAGRARSAQP